MQKLDLLLNTFSFEYPELVRERVQKIVDQKHKSDHTRWSIRDLDAAGYEDRSWLYWFYFLLQCVFMFGFVHVLSEELLVCRKGWKVHVI